MTVDTLTLARELRAASFEASQAEALAAAIGRSAETTPSTADLSRIEARVDAVLAAINAQAESLRVEMTGLRVEMKAEMRATVEAVNARIEAARSSLLTWIVSVIVAGIGVAVAMVKHG